MTVSTATGWRDVAARVLVMLLAATLLLSAPAPARATQTESVPARCAACRKKFTAVRVRSSNTYGGIDTDGCVCPNGDAFLTWLVVTCPHCLCSRIPAHRERAPWGDAAQQYLAEQAKDRPFPESASQEDIPTVRKFELAVGLLEAEGAPAQMRAALWRMAAWALRTEARERTLAPEHGWDDDVPDAWDELASRQWNARVVADRQSRGSRTLTGRELGAAAQLLEREPDDVLVRLRHALVLRAHGELHAALPLLRELRKARAPKGAGSDVEQTVGWAAATAVTEVMQAELERTMLQRALDSVTEATASGDEEDAEGNEDEDNDDDENEPVDDDVIGERLRGAWFVWECRRRLGDDEGAAELFRGLAAAGELADPVLLVSHDVAAHVGEHSPLWAAAVEQAWQARLEALVDVVVGGEESGLDDVESAAQRLARFADAGALPSLIALLDETDAVAAAGAVTALAGYESLRPDVLARIEALADDPDADVEVRWAAVYALERWGARSSVEVFRGLAVEPDDYLLEPALRGLGVTGDPEDVEAIVRRADEEPEAALWGISVLCGRAFDDIDEFKSWYAENPDSRTWPAHEIATLRDAPVGSEPLTNAALLELVAEHLVDPSLPVRWTAYRALRDHAGLDLASAQFRYEGVFRNPRDPNEPIDLDVLLGRGGALFWGGVPVFDLDDMGPAIQPLRDQDGAHVWERGVARWRASLGLAPYDDR